MNIIIACIDNMHRHIYSSVLNTLNVNEDEYKESPLVMVPQLISSLIMAVILLAPFIILSVVAFKLLVTFPDAKNSDDNTLTFKILNYQFTLAKTPDTLKSTSNLNSKSQVSEAETVKESKSTSSKPKENQSKDKSQKSQKKIKAE